MDFYTDRSEQDWVDEVTDAMVCAGQERTEAWTELWASGLNQVYNNQRSGIRVNDEDDDSRDADIQVNYAWPAMMQEAAIQAQRSPLIMVEAHDEGEEGDRSAAEFWEGHLQHRYEYDLGMLDINKAASLDAFCYGIYIAKVFWEPHAEWDEKLRKWIGRPKVNLLYPPYFGADPEAEWIDGSTSYVYSGRRVSVDWMLQRWGKDPALKEMILDAAEKDPYNSDFARDGQGGSIPTFFPHGTSEAEMATAFQRDGGEDLTQKASRGRVARLIEQARGLTGIGDIRNRRGQPKHLTLLEIYFRDMTEQQRQDVEDIPLAELEADGSIYLEDSQWHVGNPEVFKKTNPKLKEGDLFLQIDHPTRSERAMEPSFPRGRFVLKIGKGQIMNPTADEQRYPYKRWPYMTGVYHGLPHVWQGLNGTEMSESVQYWINSSYTALLNFVNYYGNPQTVREENALADENAEVTGKPGGVIVVKETKLDKIKRLEQPTMSAAVPKVIEMMQREAQAATGKHDTSLGRETKGQQTAYEIAQKQNADLVRTTLQVQRRDAWNAEIMELVKEMDQANLEVGDWLKLTSKEFTSRLAEYTDAFKALEFAVKLKIGTGLPIDKEKKKQDLERLADKIGVIPILKELLEAFEIENVDEVLQRVEEYQEFLAFVEQKRLQEEQAGNGSAIS